MKVRPSFAIWAWAARHHSYVSAYMPLQRKDVYFCGEVIEYASSSVVVNNVSLRKRTKLRKSSPNAASNQPLFNW